MDVREGGREGGREGRVGHSGQKEILPGEGRMEGREILPGGWN